MTTPRYDTLPDTQVASNKAILVLLEGVPADLLKEGMLKAIHAKGLTWNQRIFVEYAATIAREKFRAQLMERPSGDGDSL